CLGFLFRNHGGEHCGFAVGGENGAVSLTGDLAGFENERAACPFDLFAGDVEHEIFLCLARERAAAGGFFSPYGKPNPPAGRVAGFPWFMPQTTGARRQDASIAEIAVKAPNDPALKSGRGGS